MHTVAHLCVLVNKQVHCYRVAVGVFADACAFLRHHRAGQSALVRYVEYGPVTG